MMPGMQDSPGSLTQAELEREADVPTEYVHELVEAGILRPAAPGAFAVADISRVRLARALLDGGVSTDDLRWAIEAMGLPIDQVADTFTPPSRSDHTFGELIAALGTRGENLPSVYAAFGLAVPPIDAPVPADEERLVTRFLDVWATVDEAPDVAVRAAHIIGDGMRRITAGTLELFDEHGGSPPPPRAAPGGGPRPHPCPCPTGAGDRPPPAPGGGGAGGRRGTRRPRRPGPRRRPPGG